MQFALEVYSPATPPLPLPVAQRTDWLTLDPRITSLKVSTAIPGGFIGLTAGLGRLVLSGNEVRSFAQLPRAITLADLAHVRLQAGAGFTAFEGRLTAAAQPGSEITGFVAAGYGKSGLDDNPFSSSDTNVTTAGAVLRRVLASAAPLIVPSSDPALFVDSLVPHAPAEFDAKKPLAIVDQLAKEAGYDWSVWENGQLWFLPRVAPQLPHYLVPFDPAVVVWSRDASAMAGSITVDYTDAATNTHARTPPAIDPTFVDRAGMMRSDIVSGGTLTQPGALAYAAAQLAVRSQPAVSATLTLSSGRGLTTPYGGERDAALVRAGEWIQIADQPPLVIVKTDYDANTQQLKLECGQRVPDWRTLVSGLISVAQYTRKGLNANTAAAAG